MLHPSDKERLSAYFDEELSSHECAEVERLLRDDPAARAWLEQIADLHAELQSLPKLRLEPDFADSVMRRAEREMLLREEVHPQEAVSSAEGERDDTRQPVAGENGGALTHHPATHYPATQNGV